MEREQFIFTNDNCIGCNRCIGACHCPGANASKVDSRGHSHIVIDANRCIGCGACIEACEHYAREFSDDVTRFFYDLKAGKQISILVDHSFIANYPDKYEQILKSLKKLGVNRILSVSFGADITTWAYINYIKENDFLGGISQQCPSVVGFVEKYMPELIPNLMPIHSPLMCSAIYAKKYMDIQDSFAYISPCIAKKNEINDDNCKGYVDYNITFEKLIDYLENQKLLIKEKITTDTNADSSDDVILELMGSGLGCGYFMTGGLKENIQWFLGDDIFIRQMDGQEKLYQYLRTNKELFLKNETDYMLIDACNCAGGCLSGSACHKSVIDNECSVMELQKIKESVKSEDQESPWSLNSTCEERLQALNKQFEHLKLGDFIRHYTDKSASVEYKLPTKAQEEHIFSLLKKDTEEKRNINCGGCGYESCKEMAAAMLNGCNYKENCVHYTRDLAMELADNLATELIEKNYNSRHDSVTGLYNAEEFYRISRKELMQNQDKVYYMAALDVRQFKLINDIYGYEQGDKVLKREADMIREVLGSDAIFGRITGDKFAILIEVGLIDSNRLLAQFDSFEDEIAEIGINVFLQAGMCLVEDHNIEPSTLFDRACMAIRTIKSSYTEKLAYFCEDMREKSIRSQKMVSEFGDALKNNEFQIFVQPQFSADNEQVGGGEVLVRWIHPKKGVIAPGSFIPIFEECGLISTLDLYVWKKTCEKLKEWKKRGRDHLYLSVNISPYDLHAMNIYDVMTGLVEEYEISPHNLKLEITETAVMTDVDKQLKLIEKLKAYGFTVEMDDFGSGYSSLNMLKDINVNTLKIDMMFLSKTKNTEKSDMILKTIIMLSKQLGLNVVTEGVETKEQVEFLKNSGSDVFQGYFYAKPMPIEEFDKKYA